MEYSSSCLYDYLLIYDGGRTDSPLLGRYCWNGPIPTIISTGNALLLEFRSDNWFNMGGYTANYYFGKKLWGIHVLIGGICAVVQQFWVHEGARRVPRASIDAAV